MSRTSPLVLRFCPLLGAALILLNRDTLTAEAQPAALDTNFNAAAVIDGHVQAIALQLDGKIVAAGDISVALADNSKRVGVIRLNEDGSLDLGFSLGNAVGRVQALAIQTDGKIFVTGDYLQRLNSDGTLDSQFALVPLEPSGYPTPNFLSLQKDGKVVVGGIPIRRFNIDGSSDLTFQSPNNFLANVVLLQTDQKIVASGAFPFGPLGVVARRLNRDGSLDLELGSNRLALGLQPDGKIILLESDIRRINPDGALDESFRRTNLGRSFEQVYVVVIQPDGKILFGGRPERRENPPYKFILRLEANGEVDLGFDSSTGIVAEPAGVQYVEALAVDAKGRIVVGGAFKHFGQQPVPPLIRLQGGESLHQPLRFIHPPQNAQVPAAATVELSGEALGYPNPSYRWFHNGKTIPAATNSTLSLTKVQLSDFGTYQVLASNSLGTITAEAFLDVALFTSAGSLDVSFRSCDEGNCLNDLLLGSLRNGKLLIQRPRTDVQRFSSSIELWNEDGTTQRRLPIEAAIPDFEGVYSATFAEQPSGKIVILGRFLRTAREPVNMVLRFSADGELDSTFEPASVYGYQTIAVSPTGQIYVAAYRPEGFSSVPVLRRLRPDGGFDPDFTVGFLDVEFESSYIGTLRVHKDGNLFVAGRLSIDGASWKSILRLSPDGAVDPAFDVELTPGSYIRDVLVQPDGKCLLLGGFALSSNLLRVTSIGKIDDTFHIPRFAGNGAELGSILLQTDGKILVGGFFSGVDGVARNNIARLNSDGTLDMGFEPFGGTSDGVWGMAIQNNEEVVPSRNGYRFEFVNGVNWSGLPRLNLVDMDPPVELATPRILNLRRDGNQLRLSFRTVFKWIYQIEAADSLDELQWTAVASRQGDGFSQMVEIPLPVERTRFFRLSVTKQ